MSSNRTSCHVESLELPPCDTENSWKYELVLLTPWAAKRTVMGSPHHLNRQEHLLRLEKPTSSFCSIERMVIKMEVHESVAIWFALVNYKLLVAQREKEGPNLITGASTSASHKPLNML